MLTELLRTKKWRLGVMRPCMFSMRASRPAVSRWMNGAGSLKNGESVAGSTAGCAAAASGRLAEGSIPTHAASTAAAPPASISRRNWRRPIPRALANAHSGSPPSGWSVGPWQRRLPRDYPYSVAAPVSAL